MFHSFDGVSLLTFHFAWTKTRRVIYMLCLDFLTSSLLAVGLSYLLNIMYIYW